MGNKIITDDYKTELVYRRYIKKEPLENLSDETGIGIVTLDRSLRRWRGELGLNQPIETTNTDAVESVDEEERQVPSHNELFNLLRKEPLHLSRLMEMFDRSESTIRGWIEDLREAGYVITEKKNHAFIDTRSQPKISYVPARTLADEQGQEVIFAAASDLHAGSTHSQPSAYNKFIRIAYEEYGVRDVFDPGDITTGVAGYRGQDYDIIDPIRPWGRDWHNTSLGQLWLADAYAPKLPGLRYFKLGGNHDAWHISKNGLDIVRMLTERRDDMVYLGYDVNDIPLTDRASVRLWHPGGGGAYALSYRLQKGTEQMAMDELHRAIEENDNPNLRIILAGHMHTEIKFQSGPLVAAHVGCFEGQTNYLKKKGLYPTIGGAIFKVRLTDSGLIQRIEYTFIPFTEVEDDWKNWPVPPTSSPIMEKVLLEDPIFKLKE